MSLQKLRDVLATGLIPSQWFRVLPLLEQVEAELAEFKETAGKLGATLIDRDRELARCRERETALRKMAAERKETWEGLASYIDNSGERMRLLAAAEAMGKVLAILDGEPQQEQHQCRTCGGRGVLLIGWAQGEGKATLVGEEKCPDCRKVEP